MTFSIAQFGIILEMMGLHLSIEEEDIIEHSNGKCHMFNTF